MLVILLLSMANSISMHPILVTRLIPATSHNRDLTLRPHNTTDQRNLNPHTKSLLNTMAININLAVMTSITPIPTNSSSRPTVTILPVTLRLILATHGPITPRPILQLIRAVGTAPTRSTLLPKLPTSPLSLTQFSPFANSSLVLRALDLSSLLSSPKDRSSSALCSLPPTLVS